jgi:IS4 transposase
MDKNTVKTSFGKYVNVMNLENLAVPIQEMDRYMKKYSFESYLHFMIYAHLNEIDSLRALEDALINKDLQAQLGFETLSVSQLSRKHRAIDSDILAAIFAELSMKIKGKGSPTKFGKPLYLIDSSTITLNKEQFPWASFRSTKAGVKLHLRLVFMDDIHQFPDQAVITPALEHDNNQLDILMDEKDVMYVFDRGYMDFERFDELCREGYTFLTRIKKNTVVTEVETRSVEESPRIKSDRVVRLGSFQKMMDAEMRVIEVWDTKQNLLRLTTNDMETPAETIAEMYRNRWQIELFFRWIKQHVTIKRFFSFDEEAAQNQIYIALITFCLLVLHRQETQSKLSPLKVARRLKALIWQPCQEWKEALRSVP